jgi:4-hydroxyphenylpyruvate dioxygenase-like putative hemolysin
VVARLAHNQEAVGSNPAPGILICVVICFSLFGCAKNVASKSGASALRSAAAVRNDVQAAKQKIVEGAEAVKAATGDNRELHGAIDVMERKTIIIDRWLETHPQ